MILMNGNTNENKRYHERCRKEVKKIYRRRNGMKIENMANNYINKHTRGVCFLIRRKRKESYKKKHF